LRVIFDLSALHGERLSLLRAAPLDLLRRRGLLTFLNTPIFVEEILRGSRSPRLAESWRDNLAFALDLKPVGYFLDKEQIWRDELVCGRGPYARHMMPNRSTRRWDAANTLEDKLRRVVTTGDLGDVWEVAGPEIDEARQRRQNQRRIAVEIREAIAERLRTGDLLGDFRT